MSSKVKLIDSDFNAQTGISTATIMTPLGAFTGKAKLHEADFEFVSRYAGCEYSEMRAYIKYMKKKINIINNQIKGLEDYQKILKGKTLYNHNSMECRTLRKRLYILHKEKNDWVEKINSLSKKLYLKMMTRNKIAKNLKEE